MYMYSWVQERTLQKNINNNTVKCIYNTSTVVAVVLLVTVIVESDSFIEDTLLLTISKEKYWLIQVVVLCVIIDSPLDHESGS